MAIDLERFPTSETAKRMMSRVSSIYDKSYMAKWLYQVMGLEWDTVREMMNTLPEQAFVKTAGYALPYWENLYGIATDETKNTEQRRLEIAIRRGTKGPLNPVKLENMIHAAFGCETIVTENISDYCFSVTLINFYGDWKPIENWLKRMKPSHLALQLNISCQVMKNIFTANGIMVQILQNIRTNFAVYSPQGIPSPEIYFGSGINTRLYQHVQLPVANPMKRSMTAISVYTKSSLTVQIYQYIRMPVAGTLSHFYPNLWANLEDLTWGNLRESDATWKQLFETGE